MFITMNTHRPEDTAPHVDSFAAENSPQQVLKELGGGGVCVTPVGQFKQEIMSVNVLMKKEPPQSRLPVYQTV